MYNDGMHPGLQKKEMQTATGAIGAKHTPSHAASQCADGMLVSG
jgi:hypothetical protein